MDDTSTQAHVVDHYARGNLIAAIGDGLLRSGKTPETVTIEDLSPVDEFHIGGRAATEDLMGELRPSATDHLLDVGCGLGGAARFAAHRFGCRITGVDITADYVAAGNTLSEWVGLAHLVSLQHADAVSLPSAADPFTGGYMLHVGMNVRDKPRLCREVSRLLRSGALFAIYDVMQTSDGELDYPLPWATTPAANALATPDAYRAALQEADFEIISERNRRDFALDYFRRQQAHAAVGQATLGLHILMGSRRRDQVLNMIANISNARIAPVEMIARKR